MSNLYVAMYHYTRDLQNSKYPNIKGLDYNLFKQQILFFNENFHVVSMEEVIDAFNYPDKQLPDNAILLTFDDGYIDNYKFAYPLLKQLGIQGSFFIPGKTFRENKLLDVNKIHFTLASSNPSDLLQDLFEQMDYYRGNDNELYPSNDELFEKYANANRFDCKEIIFIKRILQTVLPEDIRNIISSNLFHKYVGISESVFAKELYMNREQIDYMKKDGMHIGIHGYEHYWLNNLTQHEMERDIDMALDTMSDFIDINNWVMNYPYGSYAYNVTNYIESKGCKLGLTTDVRIANTNTDNKYLIPRLDCNDFPPKSQNYMSHSI